MLTSVPLCFNSKMTQMKSVPQNRTANNTVKMKFFSKIIHYIGNVLHCTNALNPKCMHVHFNITSSGLLIIIPCSQYSKLNLNPNPKSNEIFNPSKLKYDKQNVDIRARIRAWINIYIRHAENMVLLPLSLPV